MRLLAAVSCCPRRYWFYRIATMTLLRESVSDTDALDLVRVRELCSANLIQSPPLKTLWCRSKVLRSHRPRYLCIAGTCHWIDDDMSVPGRHGMVKLRANDELSCVTKARSLGAPGGRGLSQIATETAVGEIDLRRFAVRLPAGRWTSRPQEGVRPSCWRSPHVSTPPQVWQLTAHFAQNRHQIKASVLLRDRPDYWRAMHPLQRGNLAICCR